MKITIKLLSDLCTASGETHGSIQKQRTWIGGYEVR